MRMVNLVIFVGRVVNGVVEFYIEILKKIELNNWYKLYFNKF